MDDKKYIAYIKEKMGDMELIIMNREVKMDCWYEKAEILLEKGERERTEKNLIITPVLIMQKIVLIIMGL